MHQIWQPFMHDGSTGGSCGSCLDQACIVGWCAVVESIDEAARVHLSHMSQLLGRCACMLAAMEQAYMLHVRTVPPVSSMIAAGHVCY